jgi:hypothetical protein
MNLALKKFLVGRDQMTIEKEKTASQGKENKTMTEFVTDSAMEILLQAKQKQPELFAQLPATTKMSLGIYQTAKQNSVHTGLTADEKLTLNEYGNASRRTIYHHRNEHL